MKINLLLLQGQEKINIGAEIGLTLLEALRDADIPVIGICEGSCTCATCQVYIEEPWFSSIPQMEDEEESALDFSPDTRPNSRLACQVKLTEELEGMTFTMAPGSYLQT